MTHRDFRFSLVKKLIESVEFISSTSSPDWTMCFIETRFEINFSSHLPYPSPRLYCRACSARGIKKKRSQVTCKK